MSKPTGRPKPARTTLKVTADRSAGCGGSPYAVAWRMRKTTGRPIPAATREPIPAGNSLKVRNALQNGGNTDCEKGVCHLQTGL